MKTRALEVGDNNTITISVNTKPCVILIGEGKAIEVKTPHQGEVLIKTAHGKIHNFETKEKELF